MIRIAPSRGADKADPLAIFDGRDPVGIVRESSGTFTAVDVAGRTVGVFSSLTDASRALPARSSS
jgi:hypothetical protein